MFINYPSALLMFIHVFDNTNEIKVNEKLLYLLTVKNVNIILC